MYRGYLHSQFCLRRVVLLPDKRHQVTSEVAPSPDGATMSAPSEFAA